MRWIVSLIVVLALVAGLWWMEQQRQAELALKPDVSLPAEPREPEPRYPLPQPEPQPAPAMEEPIRDETRAQREPAAVEPEARPPLPELPESDEAVLEALSGLIGSDLVEHWVRPEFVISRTVVIVNSLDGPAPALKSWPIMPLDSEPITEERQDGDTLLWTTANAERYAMPITALESVPPAQAAALYGRYYPLFQQAWDELGENEPHFNDRLIDVVDHLLAASELELPFEVVPHEGRMHFADEALQEESWGRKLLMRMGTEQAGTVKEWLRKFRNAIVQTTDSP